MTDDWHGGAGDGRQLGANTTGGKSDPRMRAAQSSAARTHGGRYTHVSAEWDWLSWSFGFAGPYIGYTRRWANFYLYLGPLTIDFEWVRRG